MSANTVVNHTFRFVCRPTGSLQSMYTNKYYEIPANALCFSQSVSYNATNAVNCFSSYRIKKVEMWYSPPGVLGAGQTGNLPTLGGFTISVTPTQTVNGKLVRMKEYADTVLSISDTAHVVWRPSKQTLAGNFNAISDASPLMGLELFPGTVIDISIEAIFADGHDEMEITSLLIALGSPFPAVGGAALDTYNAAGAREILPVGIQTCFV